MTPSSHTVLVVEDDPVMRPLLRHVLARCLCRVLEATSGPKAIATIEQHDGPLHLLLVDLNRPRATGPQLSAQVRAMRPGVRVLHLCGSPLALRSVDNDDQILKPFRLPELVAKVIELLPANGRKTAVDRSE
jgi:two-component system, cell cycle sensor histidine kinase and response regulator CckA